MIRRECRRCVYMSGWSSPVARQAHNLKVVGSNPTPATNVSRKPVHSLAAALTHQYPSRLLSRSLVEAMRTRRVAHQDIAVNVFAKRDRILAELRRESGGSFSVVYNALSQIAAERKCSKLRLDDVKGRIKKIRAATR